MFFFNLFLIRKTVSAFLIKEISFVVASLRADDATERLVITERRTRHARDAPGLCVKPKTATRSARAVLKGFHAQRHADEVALLVRVPLRHQQPLVLLRPADRTRAATGNHDVGASRRLAHRTRSVFVRQVAVVVLDPENSGRCRYETALKVDVVLGISRHAECVCATALVRVLAARRVTYRKVMIITTERV